MEKRTEDLFFLAVKYSDKRSEAVYGLIKENGEWKLYGGCHTFHLTPLRIIRNSFKYSELVNVLKEVEGKKFKIWVYAGRGMDGEDEYKQIEIVPTFLKIPVEVNLKYFPSSDFHLEDSKW